MTTKNTLSFDVTLTGDQAIAQINKLNQSAKDATLSTHKLAEQGTADLKKLEAATKSVNTQYDSLGSVQRAESVLKVSEGIAGGFAAAQGAMALFGSESEELQKTLLKVQSALAISQGIKMVTEGVSHMGAAFDTLKKAILGNPIIAVGAALFAGIAYAISQITTEVDKETAAIDKQIEANNKKFDAEEKGIQHIIDLKKADGKFTGELEKDKLQLTITRIEKEIELEEKKHKLLINQAFDALEVFSDNDAELEKLRKRALAGQEADSKKLIELRESLSDAKNALEVKDYELQKYYADKAEADRKKRFEDRKKSDAELNAQLASDEDKVNKDREEKFDKFRVKAQEIENIPLRVVKVTDQALEDQVSAYEKFSAATEKFANFLNGNFGKISSGISSTLNEGLNVASAFFENAQTRQLKAVEGNEAAQDKIKKKFFDRNKKAQIAQAGISTFVSAVEAYKATVGIPIVGPFLAPVNAGLAIAAGFANINRIKQQEYESESSGGGGSTSQATAPNINPPRTVGSDQDTTNINPDGSVGNNGTFIPGKNNTQANMRVFVVASDVQAANMENDLISKRATV